MGWDIHSHTKNTLQNELKFLEVTGIISDVLKLSQTTNIQHTSSTAVKPEHWENNTAFSYSSKDEYFFFLEKNAKYALLDHKNKPRYF